MIEMPEVERNPNNEDYIKTLYEMDVVLFEHCILESDQYSYSICYCPKQDVYDVVLQDNINNKLINYESRKILSDSTLKYYNLTKDEEINDNFGNTFKCITHKIEFTI